MKHEYKSTSPKDAIGPTLIKEAKKNDRLVVLSSDVSISANIEMFHQVFPQRFFEMGIAEQSTMSVSGGLASEGFVPVYVALAIFSCGMTWAQMRQICNSNLNVKIIGTHAGVDDGQDGAGHHATEDLAISRAIPNMTVLTPSDEFEVEAAIRRMIAYNGPVYMRIAREEQPIIHEKNCNFEIGRVEVIEDLGNDFVILYEGSALKQALEGWELAKAQNKHGKLVSVRTIKPLDGEYIKYIANKVGVIVTVENHSRIGGLYGAVSEYLAGMKSHTRIFSVAFDDEFTESGSSREIKRKYGLAGENILRSIQSV